MRYIKTYEYLEKNDIKKYIVYYFKRYYIDRFINIDNGTIYFNNIYHYKKSEKLENDKIDEIETANYLTYLDNIKFSSDDLSECEKYVELNISTNKYNL